MATISAADAAGPRMRVDREIHNYGTVLYGDRVVEKFQFTNSGDEILVIDKVRPDCACTKVEALQREISPGGTGTIVAELDTVGLSQGAKRTNIIVQTNDASRPVVKLTLIAYVQRQVDVTPAFLAQKLRAHTENISFRMKIFNTSDRPVTLQSIDVKGAGVAATLSPSLIVVPPLGEVPFTIEMTLSEDKGRTIYAGNVLLRTDHHREQEMILRYFIQVGETR
ncbi:MAG: DUF1573 domain-containing protein [Desulfomonile sp.]|nr:DUF1573 domain-containing protein [Desulfomonile sp.]